MVLGSVFGPLANFGDQIVEPNDPFTEIQQSLFSEPGVDPLRLREPDRALGDLFSGNVDWSLGFSRLGQFLKEQAFGSIFGEPSFNDQSNRFEFDYPVNDARTTSLLDDVMSIPGSPGPALFPDRGLQVPTFPDFNTLSAQLDANRQALVDARNQAVRKSGSSAAAPYDRAIAKINAEIAKLEQANLQKDQLFGGIDERTTAFYDRAVEAAKPLAADASAAQMVIRGQVLEEQGKIVSKIKSDLTQSLSSFGPGVATVAAAGMEEIENMVFSDLNAEFANRENIARASGAVALASAKLARASNRVELERQRLQVQFKIDEQVDGLLEQRKELVARRAAAVARARQAAFNAFPSVMPRGQAGYAFAHVQQFVYNQMQGRDVSERDAILQALSTAFQEGAPVGVTGGTFTYQTDAEGNKTSTMRGGEYEFGPIKTLRDARYFVGAIQEQAGVDFTPDDFDFYTKLVFESTVLYRQGLDIWTNEIAIAPPEIYAPGTTDRYNALYAELMSSNPLATDDEADDYARDPLNHEIYTPGETGRGAGTQTQPGYGVRVG